MKKNKIEDKKNNIKKNDPGQKTEKWKYALSIFLILALTTVSLVLALYSAGDKNVGKGAHLIWDAIANAEIGWLLGLVALVVLGYMIDALICWFFCRLYTRHYKYRQALANIIVGAFYSAVTPGASGGQVAQVYVMKKQGVGVSNSASIMVMTFILYQTNLIIFDIIAVAVLWPKIELMSNFKIGNMSLIPLIILGFVINISILALLILLSYSRHFHNFVMHHLVNFGAKIHLIKNPDKTRENLRVQVENFKIELRRLQSNIPITIVLSLFFILNFFVRYSMPYFSAAAVDATGPFDANQWLNSVFTSAFHQMVSGLFPLPGNAGSSEFFYNFMFGDFIGPTKDAMGNIIRDQKANIASSQILWRTASFHIVVIFSGLFSAIYRAKSGGTEEVVYANRQTFVDLQLQTYEERKQAVDTLYETKQLSKKNIQTRIKQWDSTLPRKKNKYIDNELIDASKSSDDDDYFTG